MVSFQKEIYDLDLRFEKLREGRQLQRQQRAEAGEWTLGDGIADYTLQFEVMRQRLVGRMQGFLGSNATSKAIEGNFTRFGDDVLEPPALEVEQAN